ncbi:hypothetical protein [Streptomyces sp. NPDC054854]
MDEPEERAAAVYAAALRKALAGFTASGGTQKEIAKALNAAPATLSRYLSGERVAPRDFLRALRGYLEERGMPWPHEIYEELDALCGHAHTASGSPAVQLAQLREELARLRHEQQQAQQVGEARLADLEHQAGQLAQQLQEALDRAQTAEGSRKILLARVERQDDSLRHAQDYIHQVEAELTQQREQARQLQLEVGVLREQNRRLVEERQSVPGASTQDTSFEATLAARRIRIAETQESLDQSAMPSGPNGQQKNPHTKPSTLSTFGIPVATPARYMPIRDGLIVLVMESLICFLALAFGAGMRTTPGGFSIVKLIAAAVIFLLVSAACWATSFMIGEKYVKNGWTLAWPSNLTLFGGPVLLVAGVVTPFILGTEAFWHWLADAAQLV